jgi:mRNA interferase HicA
VYVNRPERKVSTVPRHRELNDFLAAKICKDSAFQNPASNNALQRTRYARR